MDELLTSKQAFDLAVPVADKELKSLLHKIEKTAKNGGFILTERYLNNYIINQLKSLGYEVRESESFERVWVISWDA